MPAGEDEPTVTALWADWSRTAQLFLRPQRPTRRASFLFGFRPEAWGPEERRLCAEPAALASEGPGRLCLIVTRCTCPASAVRQFPTAHDHPWPRYFGFPLERGFDSHLLHVDR